MQEFFATEWKTIVAVVLFAGTIYGWFYAQEIADAETQKNTPAYEYTCLRAGAGILGYDLGTPINSVDLTGFTKSTDELLGVERYLRQDKAVELSFRNGRIASVAYYPDAADEPENCRKDAEKITAAGKETAQPIPVENRISYIYEGIVRVDQDADPVSKAPGADPAPDKMKTYAWIVTPI